MIVRRHRAAWAPLILWSAACAPPDDSEPLPIDVCGQDRPVQILALGDDEYIEPIGGVARFGERWLFGVRRFEIPLTSLVSTTVPAALRPFAQLDARIESVGTCGEDRTVVAEGPDLLFPPRSAGEPWLGCRKDTGELYWIDPTGTSPARMLAQATFCGGHLVREDQVFVLTTSGEFVRARLSEGSLVADSLITDVVQADAFMHYEPTREGPEQDAFLLRGDRVLVRVDLATGATEEIMTRVDEFSISRDRRWLVWIRRVPDDPNDVEVPEAQLLDRTSSDARPLGRPEWTDVQAWVSEHYVTASGKSGPDADSETQLMSLPGLHSIMLPGLVYARGSDDADHVVLASFPGSVEVVDLSTGERRTLPEVPYSIEVHNGAIWYQDSTPYDDPDRPFARPFDVIRMPIATLDPEVVYRRVFSKIQLHGDRWLTTTGYDENGVFDLVLLDGATLEWRRVDRDFVSATPPYTDVELGVGEPWLTDEVTYQVHERASDRGGMWRARFTD